MAAGYRAVWYLFQDEPFDIGRIYRPDGTWTGFYVDILAPVHWDGANPRTLQPLVDLFLDVWITPDGRHLVLDEDEFAQAQRELWIAPAQAEHAQRTLHQVIAGIAAGAFPPAVAREAQLTGEA